MGLPQWIILAVALQRLAELVYARRNTRHLLAAGGVESGAGHYPLFILLHGGWLLALFLLIPADAAISWWLLGLFIALQAARLWVIASLGRSWTTRIIVRPNAPLVRHGPYRWMRHPNYAIVAVEIIILPLAFGEWAIALIAGLANAALLRHRIGREEAALAAARSGTRKGDP